MATTSKTAKKSTARKPAKKIPAVSANGDAEGQTFIPGTEPPSIPLIDRDLKRLAATRHDLKLCKTQETEILTEIATRMHVKSLTRYKGAGFTVDIVPSGEAVKVKPAKDK